MAGEKKKPESKPTLGEYWGEISEKAEEIYRKRTEARLPGDQLSDWLEAEKQVKKSHGL
jgi:hypothetical protein